MRLTFITGLIALQLAAALTATAQNYYVKISGDQGTRIADHGSWQQGPLLHDQSLETYNLRLAGNDNAVGMMLFFGPGGTITWASHYRLNSATDRVTARRILTPEFPRDLHVIGEQYNGSTVKSAVILRYDLASGHLLSARALPTLPSGYKLVRVFDVISELENQESMRILCLVSDGSAQTIMELIYNKPGNSYTIKNYKPLDLSPDRYRSAYYVRAYHYSAANLGKVSFYGLATYGDRDLAYCYAEDKFEVYEPQSARGKSGATGVQMNGSYGADGVRRRIDMAFVDLDGNLCLQQKDEQNTLNWRRFYYVADATFEMGFGRDGHGVKQGGGKDYFMAATHFSSDAGSEGHVTSLHYNALNGDLDKLNVFNFSGVGVQKGGGFPNTTDDPGYNYTFIADRFDMVNGFKFGTGNAASGVACTKPVTVKEQRGVLKESKGEVHVGTFGPYRAQAIDMVAVNDISVAAIPECNTEQRGIASGDNTLQGSSNLHLDANRMQLEAPGKTITAMRVLSVDGRLITEQRNLSSSRYEQHFNTPLTPGIYVVSLEYADHSRENRKISVH